MKEDQRKRLADLQDDLIEVVLQEADPNEWPGAGKPLASLEQQERGDRYWCKKNASATLVLATKIQSLLSIDSRPEGQQRPDDADLEKEQRDAEREAERILGRIGEAGSKRDSRRTH